MDQTAGPVWLSCGCKNVWVQAQHPWGLLLGTLALVARHDPRADVADQAAAGMLECMRSHSTKWDGGTWHAVHAHAIAYLFEAPFAKRSPAGGAAPRMVPPLPPPVLLQHHCVPALAVGGCCYSWPMQALHSSCSELHLLGNAVTHAMAHTSPFLARVH